MKLSVLVGERRILLTVCALILSSILLAGCGRGGTTIESTEATTNGGVTTESTVASQESEEGVAPVTPSAPTPPSPTPPTPTPPTPPPPPPPVAQEVNCGIGAFNVLNCTNTTGEQFSCSGDSHAVGSPYGCTNTSSGSQFSCVVISSRMGGFTLSCTGPPQ